MNCFVCSSSEIQLYKIDKEYELFKCSNCGLVFTNPSQIADCDPAVNFYDSAGTVSDEELYKQEAYIPLIEYVLPIILNKSGKTKKLKALDIGCGPGTFLRIIKKNNIEEFGLDASDAMISKLKEQGFDNVRMELFTENTFPGITFDIITLWNVLEHVPNPKEIMSLCYKRLNPGGVLFFKVPNISFHGPFSNLRKKSLEPKCHLFNFSYKSIILLLGLTGFKNRPDDLFDTKTNVVESCPSDNMFKSRILVYIKHLYSGIAKVIFYLTFRKINVAPSLIVLVKK